MGAPSRRRNPVIARGKKSDKRKKKMKNQNRAPSTQVGGITEILEKANQQRKELFRGDSPTSDKGILSEPSTLFYERTNDIRSKRKEVGRDAILLQKPEFQVGIGVSRVKKERMLVIDGGGSKVFRGLAHQFNEQKENLKQEVRGGRVEVLERARKREDQNKKIAAEEKEQKRISKELERREAAELLVIEQEKLDSEQRVKLELEKQRGIARLKIIELDRLESEQIAKIELEKQHEVAQIKAIEQEKLESERLAKAELAKQHEVARLNVVELERLAYDKGVLGKKKERFWNRIWSQIRGLFSFKAQPQPFTSKKKEIISPPPKPEEIDEPTEEAEIETVEKVDEEIEIVAQVIEIEEEVKIEAVEKVVEDIEETVIQEEVLFVEEVIERVVELEGAVDEVQIETVEEVDEKIEIEEAVIQEGIPAARGLIEQVIENKPQVLESEELQKGVEIEQDVEIEILEEVDEKIEVEEAVVQEELPAARDLIEQVIENEIETDEELIKDIGEAVVQDGVRIIEQIAKEVVGVEGLPEEVQIEEGEEVREGEVLPDIQTGEMMLADLRITMRGEPQPIEFITNILMEKHNLSKRKANILIDHLASPFSICKTMKDELFQNFIASLDGEEISSGGVEIWTQVIQIIGLDSLSGDQQVEIYNMFMGDEKKVNRKVKAVAILLHFLPIKFNRWWLKEMIPKFVSEKYDSDYKFYQGKQFSKELIEEARMLICAYAIEKPSSVAKGYTYAKHQAGKVHENQTEEWLKKGGDTIEYITEKTISGWNSKLSGQKYGDKHVISKITPDLLLRKPIQLSADGQHIHWIDAKKHFIDPALSPEYKVGAFCQQLEKYVGAYGPGLVVWGKDFSEEWNEATKGVVQHIKI